MCSTRRSSAGHPPALPVPQPDAAGSVRPVPRGSLDEEINVKDYDRLYIGGEWVQPDGTGSIDGINASTEEVKGGMPAGSPAAVDPAGDAAAAAFEAWAATSPNDRAKYIQAMSD